MPEGIELGGAVVPAALVQINPAIAAAASGSPGAGEDGHRSVRIVLIPLLHRATRVRQARHIEVGILLRVEPLLQARSALAQAAGVDVAVGIAVTHHHRVHISQAPDVLDVGRRGGIQPLFQHLPVLRVIQMPSGAAGQAGDSSPQSIVGEGLAGAAEAHQAVPGVVFRKRLRVKMTSTISHALFSTNTPPQTPPPRLAQSPAPL